MDLVIRLANQFDQMEANEVWAAINEELHRTYRPTMKFLNEEWTPPSDITRIVATVHGKVVGTASFYYEDDRLHVMRFGVHRDFRGKEIGQMMMNFLYDTASLKHLRKLAVYSIKEAGAVPFYLQYGFKVVSEEEAKWAESGTHAKLTDVYMEMPVGSR